MLIVCNGMKRAGSTLQYNLVLSLINKTGAGKAERVIAAAEFDSMSEQFEEWGRDESLHVIKSHELLPHTEEMLAKGTLRVCYIYRDIRDVAGSVRNKFGREGAELMRILDEAVELYYEIAKMNNVLIQRYENVIDNLPGAAREIAEYLGIEANDDLIAEVARDNSVEKSKEAAQATSRNLYVKVKSCALRMGKALRVKNLMHKLGMSKARLARIKMSMAPVDSRTLFHAGHISKHKGSAGSWRREMTKDEIEEIGTRFKKWLQDTNYTCCGEQLES